MMLQEAKVAYNKLHDGVKSRAIIVLKSLYHVFDAKEIERRHKAPRSEIEKQQTARATHVAKVIRLR